MISPKLLKLMNETESIEEDKVYFRIIDSLDIKPLKIRDYLMVNAEILDEDSKHNAYTAYFRTGILRLSRTLVGFILENSRLTIASYSKNIKKDEKLVDKISEELLSKTSNKLKIKKYFFSVLISLVLILCILSTIFIPSAIESTKKYNEAVSEFNSTAENYNEKVSMVSVANIEGVPEKTEYLNIENYDPFSISLNLLKGNLPGKIEKDTTTVKSMTEKLNESSKIIDNIYKPETDYIISVLDNIDEISNIASVTTNNDPNELLGKEHGYISCIYFTIKGLELNEDSSDPIVLGTDGGGCIEVYATLADAEERCKYLEQFDDTILYTGSYAIAGTMIIRTSYVLTNEQQFYLTDKIIQEFTKINTNINIWHSIKNIVWPQGALFL